MSFITGYVSLPVNSYDAWKNAVIGNGYDADGYAGDQCWDLCAEFWHNEGFPNNYPVTQPGGFGSAWMCWTYSRDENKGDVFDLIYNISDVKKGDVMVWNGTTAFPDGHIGFADEDYGGLGSIKVLGQNQGTGGTPTPEFNPNGGSTANVKTLSVSGFLGAFRCKDWHNTPPTPVTVNRGKFPWVLYARKLREKHNM